MLRRIDIGRKFFFRQLGRKDAPFMQLLAQNWGCSGNIHIHRRIQLAIFVQPGDLPPIQRLFVLHPGLHIIGGNHIVFLAAIGRIKLIAASVNIQPPIKFMGLSVRNAHIRRQNRVSALCKDSDFVFHINPTPAAREASAAILPYSRRRTYAYPRW